VAGQKLFAAAALSAVYDATNRVFPVSQAADENTRRRATAYGLAYVVNSYSSTRALVTALTDAETGGLEGVITFTEVGIGGGGFTISSTRPDAFQPSLGVSGIASEAERKPHRIYYSKPSEPEAVPFLNFLDIGQEGADILALAPLRDAVLLFKEDGVYSVEGTPPDSWNVRKLDLGTRLVAPQAACVLDDVCYAWTDRGVVQVSAGGVVGIPSLPIGVTLRELQRLLPANDANTKRGFWMRPHPRLGLVVLGTGTLASSTTASQQFVFHTTTGRWARWTIDLRCAAYDTETDSMVVSRNVAAWNAYYERSAESSPASYVDASLLDLSGSVDGTGLVVTIAKTAFGAFTPATGDVLVDGDDHVQRVLSVVSSGSNWAITCDLGLEGSVFDWYQSYGSTVQWLATVAPGVGSRWQEMHVHLAPSQSQPSAYVTSYPMVLGGASDITNGATVTATVSNALAVESKPIRVGVHRNIVRNTHLYPSLSVNTAGVLWRISEVDLHGTGQSQRVAR
jgi:hypothetical protein